jgi:dephospho-CoA kinase
MIIAITGSFGAGKGSVADYLVTKKGFTHYSARKFITEELVRQGQTINRDTMIAMGNELRQKYGPAYIFEELVKRAKEAKVDAVIESVRAVAEADYIKSIGGLVLGVDADPHLRYERAVRRGSETDQVTFEKWREQEIRESNTVDPTKQDIFGALNHSNFIIKNEGTLEDLEIQIEQFLVKYGN